MQDTLGRAAGPINTGPAKYQENFLIIMKSGLHGQGVSQSFSPLDLSDNAIGP